MSWEVDRGGGGVGEAGGGVGRVAVRAGAAIYDVFALDADESTGNARPLGQLVLTSPIVSSRYGDETLYFQHHTEHR